MLKFDAYLRSNLASVVLRHMFIKLLSIVDCLKCEENIRIGGYNFHALLLLNIPSTSV